MSQIRPITEGEIEPCMALKKNAYSALDIDPAVNRERILQGIRDPSFPAVYGLYRPSQITLVQMDIALRHCVGGMPSRRRTVSKSASSKRYELAVVWISESLASRSRSSGFWPDLFSTLVDRGFYPDDESGSMTGNG
jgi:hypothetical protein